MRISELCYDNKQITDIKYSKTENGIKLSFNWPNIRQVFIVKSKAYDEFDLDKTDESMGHIYTIDEYKNFYGYVDSSQEADLYTYRIFPFDFEEEEMLLYRQNSGNEITITTGVIPLKVSVAEKKKFMKNKKTVKMTVTTDRKIDKNVIVYVKKANSYPTEVNDGVVYSFATDFEPGKNILPEIETGLNEYIRIFISDAVKYGNLFRLEVV